jgi:uncharacterized coiled-coil protein SlyX
MENQVGVSLAQYMNNQTDLDKRIGGMETGIALQNQAINTLTGKIDGALKRIDEQAQQFVAIEKMNATIQIMDMKQDGIVTSMTNLRNDVDNLKMKPAQRWEDLVKQILGLLVAGVVGYIVSIVIKGG